MSRIYFHSKDCDDAEVHGSERAYMSCIINELALSVLSSYIEPSFNTKKSPILDFIKNPDKLYFSRYEDKKFEESFKMSFQSGIGDITFVHKDDEIKSFSLALNTAIAVGSDVVQLMARIHAQCEIHAYIKPENFHWMARIIDKGLKLNILRDNQGWEHVIKLLETSKEPIVTSFSVCDKFPNSYLANWSSICNEGCDCGADQEEGEDCEYEDWYELDFHKQWDLAWEELEQNTSCLELTPDGWEGYFFNKNVSAFDIIKLINNKSD